MRGCVLSTVFLQIIVKRIAANGDSKEGVYTDDVDELYESQVEAYVDHISHVSNRSNEWIVSFEQMINESNFVVAAQTFNRTTQTPQSALEML